jgi:hypothetical protein
VNEARREVLPGPSFAKNEDIAFGGGKPVDCRICIGRPPRFAEKMVDVGRLLREKVGMISSRSAAANC